MDGVKYWRPAVPAAAAVGRLYAGSVLSERARLIRKQEDSPDSWPARSVSAIVKRLEMDGSEGLLASSSGGEGGDCGFEAYA